SFAPLRVDIAISLRSIPTEGRRRTPRGSSFVHQRRRRVRSKQSSAPDFTECAAVEGVQVDGSVASAGREDELTLDPLEVEKGLELIADLRTYRRSENKTAGGNCRAVTEYKIERRPIDPAVAEVHQHG